jgi:hypothetical protein
MKIHLCIKMKIIQSEQYKESKNQFLSRKISTMQLKKCINKGCQVYVVKVTNLLGEERKPSLEYFAVLRGFRDVFVEDICQN